MALSNTAYVKIWKFYNSSSIINNTKMPQRSQPMCHTLTGKLSVSCLLGLLCQCSVKYKMKVVATWSQRLSIFWLLFILKKNENQTKPSKEKTKQLLQLLHLLQLFEETLSHAYHDLVKD